MQPGLGEERRRARLTYHRRRWLSALATRWLPKSVRLLAPSDDGREDGEPRAHVTHFMQRLVVAHVLVEAWQRTLLGKAWLPPIAPSWPPRPRLLR